MRSGLFLISLAMAGACDGGQGEDSDCGCATYEEPCVWQEDSLTMDEVSTWGFSAQDVLDFLSTGFSSDLEWGESGETTTIHMSFAEGDGTAVSYWFDQNPSSDVVCDWTGGVYLRLDVEWTTDDGLLSFHDDDMAVSAKAANDAGMGFNPSQSELTAPTDCDVPGTAEFEATGRFDASGTHGAIECQAEATEIVATWPVP